MKHPRLFAPLALAPGITLRNRIVMAPMTTWAADDDGTVSADEEAYYRHRAQNVGMVITGCTQVETRGIGFTGQFGADDDRYLPGLRRLAAAARSGGGAAILQLFHAGVKTRHSLVTDVVAASAVAGQAGPFADALLPRALRDDEILDIVGAFADATRRAIAAGFDGIELHGAHAFLLQNFFSPQSNRRSDRWGGSLENRMRFPLAVVAAIRRTIEEHADRPFALGYRISVEEDAAGGLTLAHSLALITRLVDAGVDYLHASLGSALDQTPVTAASDQTIVAILHAHLAGRIPLIVAGGLRTPAQAVSVLALGASLAAIGQGLVINPDWAELARLGCDGDIRLALAPDDLVRDRIPGKLWRAIEDTPGWFKIAPPTNPL